MSKSILSLVLFLAISLNVSVLIAQSDAKSKKIPKNVVFAELFGPGMSVSVNYDFRFENQIDGLGMRIGIGGYKINENDRFSVPIGLNYLIGRRNMFFEVGGNVVYSSSGFFIVNAFEFDFEDDTSTGNILGVLNFGLRRQAVDGGFNFRASLNPVFGIQKTRDDFTNIETKEFFFWPIYGGVSFGYSF